MRARPVRRTCLAFLAAALLAGSAMGTPRVASADHFQQGEHTLQMNIWGFRGGPSYNEFVFGEILNIVQIRSPRPLSISLNEVCKQQYEDLVGALQPMGFSSLHTYTRGGPSGKPAPNTSSCSWIGSAIFWRGGNGNSPYFGYFANQDPQSSSRRNWACAKAVFPVYYSCTAHMEARSAAGSDAVARLQTDEYLAKAEALRTSGVATVAAGDFNIDGRTAGTSNAVTIARWYPNYFEADNLSNSRAASRRTYDTQDRKLDYIFRANPKSISHGAWLYDATYSDHRWLQLYF